MSPACARTMATSTLERRHEDVLAAVQLDDLLALLGHGADAGGREKAAEARAAAAHHLGERALRRGLDLEPALVHGLADLRRGADVAGDDLLDLALLDQLDDAALAVAGVVLVDREVADVHRLEVVDQRERIALADEAADGDAHPALDVGHRLLDGDHLVLRHRSLLCTEEAGARSARGARRPGSCVDWKVITCRAIASGVVAGRRGQLRGLHLPFRHTVNTSAMRIADQALCALSPGTVYFARRNGKGGPL